MDRTTLFNPFDTRARRHEDRLTWAFAVAVKYDPALQRFLRRLVERRLPQGTWESVPDWSPAQVATQTSRIGSSTSYLVSVLLSDERLPGRVEVEWSERHAIYDILVEFSDGFTLILENKPFHGNVWHEQLSPSRASFAGDPDEVTLHTQAVSLEWAEIAEGVLRYAESGVAPHGSRLIALDFLTLIEELHPELSPYSSFELCGIRPSALRKRINALLESLAGLTGLEIGTRPGHDPYVLRVDHIAQEYHISSRTVEGAEPRIRLSLWPGDTVKQARKFYEDVDLAAFLALSDEEWTIVPKFHFSFMSTQLVHADTAISPEAYAALFVERTDEYGNKAADEETLRPLVERWLEVGLITQGDADQISDHFISTLRNHINVIPGFMIFREWPLQEVIEFEDRGVLEQVIMDALEVPLLTWGETLPRPTSA